MTKLPRAMFTAALMLAAAAPLATPAFAKKDPPPAPGQVGLKVNQKVREGQAATIAALRQASVAIGTGITAANKDAVVAALETANTSAKATEAAAVTNDELYVAGELRYRVESALVVARNPDNATGQQAGNAALVPILEKLLANPVTPQDSVAKYAFDLARIQYLSSQYRPALASLQRARAAGSTDPLTDPLTVDAMVKLGDYAGAATAADAMIAKMKAAGQKVPESFYAVGIENAYRSKNGAASTQYELKRLSDYPSTKNLHDALIRLLTRSQTSFDRRQRLEVWRLLRASKALADQKERMLYAADAFDVGAAREGLAVLQEAQAGRPVASLDPELKTMLGQATRQSAAATSPAQAEAAAKSVSDAQSALTAGNFYYSAGNYAKAAELYKLAQQRGAADKDLSLMSLGAAQAQSGDKAGAQASFSAVQSSPRKEIAAFWLQWLTWPAT